MTATFTAACVQNEGLADMDARIAATTALARARAHGGADGRKPPMSLDGVKALTFDTGGTILDWHSGFSAALAEPNPAHDIIVDGFPDLAAALGMAL